MSVVTTSQPGNRPESPHEDLSVERVAAIQRRTLWVLSIATILGGLGVGASLSVGSLLLAEVSGNDAISGLASAVFSAGTAVAGIPLARLAMRRGRRFSLVTGSIVAMLGALVAIFGASIGQWVVLVVGIAMLGVASAVQLLSRFSATDLAVPSRRARDLSLVVWAITVGAVVGPNLIGPGATIGNAIGIPALAGVFVFAFFAQSLAVLVNWFGLRPDPLFTAQKLEGTQQKQVGQADDAAAITGTRGTRARVFTVTIIAVAHAIMVALMAMTPLHLMEHDGTPEIVGVTLSFHIAGMYALSPVFGMLAHRMGRVPTIGLGFLLLLSSIVLSYFAGPSHALVQIALTLLGLGWSAVTVAGSVLLTEITPGAERPRWQGRSDTYMSAAGALAGALSGVAFAFGDFPLLAVMSGGLLALGVVAGFGLIGARRGSVRVAARTQA